MDKRYLFFIFIVVFLGILGYLIYSKNFLNFSKESISKPTTMEKNLTGKKIAMIVAFQDFRDEELFIPRSIFLNEDAEVKLVSAKKGEAIGIYGGTATIDLTFEELKVSDFDGVLFVGGGGAADYIDNEKAHQIAREAVKQNKILGAICIAPAILARAGVLKNKQAAVWSNTLDKSAVKILKEEGVNYQMKPVVIDEKIITADGPQSARLFAEKFAELLK